MYQADTKKRRYRVGILGATGVVGQQFLELLKSHPLFEVVCIAASDSKIGKKYSSAVNWIISNEIPPIYNTIILQSCQPDSFTNCDFVFSGLDSSVAERIEDAFVKAGLSVFSNAKNFRMNKHVPILNPMINPDHIFLIKQQETFKTKNSFIITNANCTTTGLCSVLAPLNAQFGISKVFMATYQAISGAGYPGVSSLDIVGNIIPYIDGEESKVTQEPKKILGTLGPDGITNLKFDISAFCSRVPVRNGHTLSISVKFNNNIDHKTIVDDVCKCLQSYKPISQVSSLHSCPEQTIEINTSVHRPQPLIDYNNGNGMTTSVGCVRRCEIFDVKMTVVFNNLILGAAGCAILNAEFAVKNGFLIRK